jgi:CheY-like chemotaxis protein
VPLRCLIVDDNAEFLAASRAILDGRDLSVVGQATSGAEALRCVAELRPELVLLDIDLGPDSGFEVARQLTNGVADPAPNMILISANALEDFVDLVAESPALGFITKTELSAAAVTALLRAHGAGDQSESR